MYVCMYVCTIVYTHTHTHTHAGINNNLRYADDTILMAESEEELKSLLMELKEESEKAGLKFSIQKTKIMASGPITSWQIEGEKMETVTDFILLGSRITEGSNYSHKINTCFLEENLWQA